MYKLCNVIVTITVLCVIYGVNAEGIGDTCTENGFFGVCKLVSECATAPELDIDLKFMQCESNGVERVVCCVDDPDNATVPTVTPATRSSTSTLDPLIEAQCASIPEHLTTEKTGQKAWDKCIDYQRQLIYPCERSVAVISDYNRVNNCKHAASTPVFGGTASNTDEFPHMVQLGYVDSTETLSSAKWSCGGTLLSEWFILTAGHCTSKPKDASTPKIASNDAYYSVKYAVLGVLESLKSITAMEDYQVYTIAKIIKHPDYKPPTKYNDIALLKTETRIILSPSAVPACLDVFGGDTAIGTATGWGLTENYEYSRILLKVSLSQFTYEECKEKYSHPQNRPRHLKSGVNEATQICYGHRNRSMDTCRGDSGGPLVIRNPRVDCMYSVVGIVSFGICGVPGTPGIYTRVSHFVPWIESVVWPDNE